MLDIIFKIAFVLVSWVIVFLAITKFSEYMSRKVRRRKIHESVFTRDEFLDEMEGFENNFNSLLDSTEKHLSQRIKKLNRKITRCKQN